MYANHNAIAFLRGTTADEDGNISMEQEVVFGKMLSMAQATRRTADNIVIGQVKRIATAQYPSGKECENPRISH